MSVLTVPAETSVEESDEAQNMCCDEQDVRDALNGNAQAWNALYARYHGLVYRMVTRKSDIPDPLGAVQSVFQAAFQHLSDLEDPQRFKSWIAQIAYRTYIDERRRMHRAVPVDFWIDACETDNYPPHISGALSTDRMGVDAEVLLAEKLQQVREAVLKLDEPFKTYVDQFYFHEWTMEKMAAENERPLGSIKSGLNRARSHLRNLLRKL